MPARNQAVSTDAAIARPGTAPGRSKRRRVTTGRPRWLQIATRVALGLSVPALIVAFWALAVDQAWVDRIFLPPPETVLAAGSDYFFGSTTGIKDVIGSSLRVFVGFLIAVGVGVPLGLAMGLWRPVSDAISPLMTFLKNIAPIAWIPLAIIWFGLGNPSAYFLIVIGAIFPIILNTVDGVRSVDRVYLRVAQNVGASTWSIFKSVIFPGALPTIMVGLRIGLGIAWMVVIIAETLAVNEGLGFRLTQAREYGYIDIILVVMITIGVLGFIYDRAMALATRGMLKWQGGIHS